MEKHKLNFEEQSRGGTEKARKAKEKKQKKQTAIQVRWSTPSSSAERTKSTPRGPTKMQLMERMAQLEQHNAELEERCAVLQERNAHLTECHVGVRIKKSSGGAVPISNNIHNLDGNAQAVGKENIAENELEAAETIQENGEFDDEPNTGNHDNYHGSVALRNLEGNAFNEEGSTSLDAPIANITVKQEQEPHQWVGAGQLYQSTTEADWAVPQEIKREIFDETPSEVHEMMALQEQQPSTSTAHAPPPPVKRVDMLRKKHELEALEKEIAALQKDREDRANHKRSLASILKNAIEPMQPTRPKCVPKRKKK